MLAEHQRAMASADAKAFFANFADDAIIMGTDATERFDFDEFRAWSAPMFTRGPRPVATLIEENITVADDGTLAWFHERIRRAGLGELRLSGVLRKAEGRWQIVQLNHAFPVPNEIVGTLIERIQNANSGKAKDAQSEAQAFNKPQADDVQAVKTVLTNFHRAAANADLEGYFKHLVDDAVVLGTAADERWTMSVYRTRVKSIFARGGDWRSTPVEQNVFLAADGRHAWFDERLVRAGVGELRGTGVLHLENGGWKIVLFNRTLVIPNEVVAQFMRLRDKTLTSDAVAQRLLSNRGNSVPPGTEVIELCPTAWPKKEFAQLIERSRTWGQPQPAASGKAGMVAGTTQVLAVRTGVEALRKGGTAMDAACVTALTQISLNVGSTVSYAGIMSLVYYEAESGEVHALMAPFATPLGEDHPLTIPQSGTPSGRSALVPGFMKGIESAHERFGKLPFASLFGPAIFFAERGILIEGPIAAWIHGKRNVLSRLPATRAVFVNDKGEFAPHGEFFRQRSLAATLRRVAAEGASHMYTGDWARAFVNAVRAEGGRISAEDLAGYDVVWSKPLQTTYRKREICTVAAPLIGGRMLLESMNLLELADPVRNHHYSKSAESYYWLIQCARMASLIHGTPQPVLKWLITGSTFELDTPPSKENARRVWKRMQNTNLMRLLRGQAPWSNSSSKKSGGHSDGVVAVDAAGNIAAMCHTINTDNWGTTGLSVQGVSIPDSAAYQQRRMEAAGPGGYLPNEMSPAIVLAEGKPILASSAIGRGLHEATVGCLHNILDFGMNPDEALQTPMLMMPYYTPDADGRSRFYKHVIQAGRYPDEVLSGLQALGQEIVELESFQASGFRGYWIGIAIDPATAERWGAVDSSLNGAALAEDYPGVERNNSIRN